MRAKGGYNDRPTVSQAAAAIRSVSANGFLRRGFSNHTNVEQETQVTELNLPDTSPRTSTSAGATNEGAIEELDTTGTEQFLAATPDDAERVVDLNVFTERETLSYVIGSYLRRLDCNSCSSTLATRLDRETSTGFTSNMTYPNAKMYVPADVVIDTFGSVMGSVIPFVEKNFFLKKISDVIVSRFRIDKNIFHSCSQEHADLLLNFFARTLLRVFCKTKNSSCTSSRRLRGRRVFLPV
ncbi:MAG: hypothetical protein AAGK05_13405 [Pseudomonadota bacterium]